LTHAERPDKRAFAALKTVGPFGLGPEQRFRIDWEKRVSQITEGRA